VNYATGIPETERGERKLGTRDTVWSGKVTPGVSSTSSSEVGDKKKKKKSERQAKKGGHHIRGTVVVIEDVGKCPNKIGVKEKKGLKREQGTA